jgi:hypothetical protein
MSITKLKAAGNWAPPNTNDNNADHTLTGRVIFGLLTGNEVPDPTLDVVTSAKDRRRRRV